MLKKIIKISLVSMVSLIIIGGGTIASIYYYGIRKNAPIEAVSEIQLSTTEAKLGQIVSATLLLKCPWHRRPTEAVAQVAKGTSLLSMPTITKQNIGWGYNIWKVSIDFKAYRTGNIPAGKLDVSYNRYNDKTIDLTKMFIIPPFKCLALKLDKKQKPTIAGEVLASQKFSRNKGTYIIILIVLTVIAALIIFIIKRRQQTKNIILPSWAIALNNLHELRTMIKSGSVGLESGFISLTDIVRSYLEKRFNLPISKQTTEEFLRQLNEKKGTLPKEQRPFLSEFMQSAELVKFAKLPPDENALNQALTKAEVLVNETRPVEEISNGGKK
jgi:hypothetical protein